MLGREADEEAEPEDLPVWCFTLCGLTEAVRNTGGSICLCRQLNLFMESPARESGTFSFSLFRQTIWIGVDSSGQAVDILNAADLPGTLFTLRFWEGLLFLFDKAT